MTQTLDQTIEQVENLYLSVTGRKAPAPAPTPFAEIPPEKDPEVHVGEQIERLLGSLSQVAQRPIGLPKWMPPLWGWLRPDHLLVQLDLPGVPRDAIRVRLANGALQVSGARPDPAPDAPRGSCYAEPPFGAFQRWIQIPADVVADQVQAQLKDGVLTVRLPRAATATATGRDIPLS